MAQKTITIPIPNHDDNCTVYYFVEYKLNSDVNYNSFQWYTDRVEIPNVADNSVYDVKITRYCCNGGTSAPLVLSIDTTTTSPQLDTPTGLALTPGVEQIAANCDDVTDAQEYVFQIATDSAFTVNLIEAVSATSNYTFTERETGTLQYVRAKARADGYQDSEYCTTVTGTPS